MIVYVDMDGVLADFDARREALVGNKYGVSATSNERKPNRDAAFWKEIWEKDSHFFANLEPMKDAYVLWNYVFAYHDAVILTALAKTNFYTCILQKTYWLRKYFGGITPTIMCFRGHKKDYAFPGSVLIDDTKRNIDEFVAAGGHGILHRSAEESIAHLQEIEKAVAKTGEQ